MFGIQNTTSCQENMQFHIDWYSNLMVNNPVQIFYKTVDIAIGNVGIRISAVTPTGGENIYVPRLFVTAGGGVSIQNTPALTTDPNPSDQMFYPMIDTTATETDLYYGYLEMVPNSGYDNTPGTGPYIVMSVGVYPTINS